jgi:hypothetical protein
MKKHLLILTIALLAMATPSCKRDYTCECTMPSNGQTIKTTGTITDTRKEAKQTCQAQSIPAVDLQCSLR